MYRFRNDKIRVDTVVAFVLGLIASIFVAMVLGGNQYLATLVVLAVAGAWYQVRNVI